MILIQKIILNHQRNIYLEYINMDRFIKTQCGLDKYKKLRAKKGILNKVRYYWFVFFASIRDLFVK